MPAPPKSKKVLIQFAAALLVAVMLGVGGLAAGLSIIGEVSRQAQQAREVAQQKAAELTEQEKRLKAREEGLNAQPRTFKVVQALTDLAPGRPITQDMVTLATVEQHPPTGSLNMLSQAVGKIVRSSILKGEALSADKLLEQSGYVQVQEGMRAMTIHVDAVGGLSGSLIPGAHVDILTTITHENNAMTRTLLQDIAVAAVGNGDMPPSSALSSALPGGGLPKPASGSDKGMSVTLIVTPRQAELLTLAGQLGAFQLTLRNFNDRKAQSMHGADLTTLITGAQPGSRSKAIARPPRFPHPNAFQPARYTPEDAGLPMPSSFSPARRKFSMRIYRGTGTETVDFQQ